MTLIATALYLFAWCWLALLAYRRQRLAHRGVQAFIAAGLIVHLASAYHLIYSPQGFDLSVFKIASLFFAVMHFLVLISSIKKPLLSLFLLLLPLGILSIHSNALFSNDAEHTVRLSTDLATHVVLSVLAYSLLTIATLQALLLAYQNRQLKRKTLRHVIGILPPLQTMEALMFELIVAGYILLTLSIITGVIFIENIFVQQLSHKTVFSVLSWGIYSTLIFGHLRFGWRGNQAIKWALVGFIALILAYFGSKFVLEVILVR